MSKTKGGEKKEVKDLQDWAAVQRLRKQKKSVSAIARMLHMSRTTVYRLIELDEEPRYKRTHYASLVDPWKEQILDWRYNPEYAFNGTRIYRELKKQGYSGSISPVYTFLKKHHAKDYTPKKAVLRIETPVGDQAQFDWSPFEVWIGERKRTVYCFAMILAASRLKAITFSFKEDGDAIYEAIQELYDDLGGVTLELLIDNPKALVIENNPRSEDEIIYNPSALLVAKHLGTELNACNCYWPRTKGKIEKPFQYIEEQFIKGNRWSDMEDLINAGKAFIDEWNNEVHSTTKRIPRLFFEQEERDALLPLPKKHLYLTHLDKRTVSPDGYISIATNKYSLPAKYAGRKVSFRIIYGFRIMVYASNGRLIQTMQMLDGKKQIDRKNEHFSEIKVVAKSIPQIRRDFTNTFENGAKYLEIASRKFDQPTHHARKILQLLDLFDAHEIDQFLAYGIEHDILDIKGLKKLIKDQGLEILHPNRKISITSDDSNSGLVRNCNYYENAQKEKYL